jgi:predicted transcriptional regulator of viral defense system
MHSQYTMQPGIAGISAKSRQRLDELHRRFAGPFTVAEAAQEWSEKRSRVSRRLAHWAKRGWLARVRAGVYMTVPLGAAHPSEQREDPWVVATKLFAPCYIGGWSACEHWGLTEQIFSGMVVFTAFPIRQREQKIQDTLFTLRVIPSDMMFGTRVVWRRETQTHVSDPSRTILDLLGEPKLGGGIRHVADVLHEYFAGEHRNEKALLEYLPRFPNRTVCKRLGYLVEVLGVQAPDLVEYCKQHMSAGYSNLDPSVHSGGRLLRRWNLDINVRVEPSLEGG